VPECSSRFTPGDRTLARQLTGVHGNPAILWVGHLDPNKDPLTVLDGLSTLLEALPQLQLWCCYGSGPLLPQLRARLAADVVLSPRVHLLGRVPHAQVEQLMRAADLFVLGSHREGSGYALIEALACGLPPVVTDIPSYRALTGGGKIGALWPVADHQALAAAVLALARLLSPALRGAVHAHFDDVLSPQSVGRQWLAVYLDALDERSGLEADNEVAAPQRPHAVGAEDNGPTAP
jgi:glycosyltransferase involved in cell wall biosynthesis